MKSKGPRLLVVGGRWPLETFIARRLAGLAARGFEVKVATNRSPGVPQGHEVPGVQWKPLPVWAGSKLRIAWDLVRMTVVGCVVAPRRVWSIVRLPAPPSMTLLSNLHMLLPFVGERPDLLHFEWNLAAVWYLPLAGLFGCPVIVSCRGSQVYIAPHNPRRRDETALLPATFEKATIIHCVSRAIRKEVESIGADPAKIRVITPAVDPDIFKPALRPAGRAGFRIVMIGSVIWSKGYDYALEALRRLRDNGVDASITILGGVDKQNRQRLLYTIEDLALGEHVLLKGTLAPRDVLTELQQADTLLLTSLSEGISNAVLEAMACGLPVVTTACPGMEEAVTEGVDGFLVPLRDPIATAGALTRLARDPELRKRMGEAGRERVMRDFRLSQQIDKWVEVYRSLEPAAGAATC